MLQTSARRPTPLPSRASEFRLFSQPRRDLIAGLPLKARGNGCPARGRGHDREEGAHTAPERRVPLSAPIIGIALALHFRQIQRNLRKQVRDVHDLAAGRRGAALRDVQRIVEQRSVSTIRECAVEERGALAELFAEQRRTVAPAGEDGVCWGD